jgi:hypothetical protein
MNNNLQEKIEQLEKELAKFKKELNSKKPERKKRQGYYSVNEDADFEVLKLEDISDCVDNYDYYMGNYFLTREEAEKQAKKMKALYNIKKYIIDNGLYFEPDWSDGNQAKFSIVCDKGNFHFIVTHDWNSPLQIGYFKSKEDVEKVINTCKEDLEILFNL